MPDEPAATPDPESIMRDRSFIALLVLAAIVGLVVSFAAWCFLELVNQLQQGVYEDLPEALGFESAPIWWALPVLAITGLIVAFAIARLPGKGGHVPVKGLNAAPTMPIELPGVLLAAIASVGLGMVVGPEAPLIALGGGLGLMAVRLLRKDAPPEVGTLVATSGVFAGVSFLFGSPVIAAVLLIEAAGLGGPRLKLVLIPGLVAAGIGSLVAIGMGSWTGVDTSAISLELLKVPSYADPDLVAFLWTVPLAAAVAVGTFLIFRVGKATQVFALPRPFIVLPVVGLLVGGLAIAFSEATGKGVDQVLFSGQTGIGPLVDNAETWSLSALALLILCKGLAYGMAVGSFRGGPTFPAMFLGAAAGLMAAQLPGFELAPAVAVGIGAGVVAVLRLPLTAVVLATLLTSSAGLGVSPLIIVGVAVAFLVSNALPDLYPTETAEPQSGGGAPPTATVPASS